MKEVSSMSFTGPTRVDDNAFDVVESIRGVMFLMRKEGLLATMVSLSDTFPGQERGCPHNTVAYLACQHP